jgi:hypothetical protein
MPELPHLLLPKAEVDLERRKRPGFGGGLARNQRDQVQKVQREVEETLAERVRLRAAAIDPRLIIRVRTAQPVTEEEWEKAGLTVLGQDDRDSVVLFSSDGELTEFRRRLSRYADPLPTGQQNPSYAGLIGAIEEFRFLQPVDRIGSSLREEGFGTLESIAEDREFLLDVELWETGTQAERSQDVIRLEVELEERLAGITDRYIGSTFTVLRFRGNGAAVRWLLGLPSVRVIDLPPQVDIDVERLLEVTLTDVGTVEAPDADAPLIGIIDSGVNNGHPLLADVVIDRVAAPASLGLSDDYGHGSKVSGVAAYGDVRGCIEAGRFKASARLMSGKVVNAVGNFDEERLIPSQMAEIVRALHDRGCRIFNISLGDRRKVYSGAKVGTWTAILDELARELDVLFVISTGNYEHRAQRGPEEHLTDYPRYLLQPLSRIVEPATAANALTVGAIASAAALGEPLPGDVTLRPIAAMGEPAPFTRAGYGVAEALKPDLCDDGGNHFYDGATQGVRRRPQSEIITTFSRYIERLFTTEIGTSYAAPLVAHKAAQVLRTLPDASANLLRALLVNSARIPEPAQARLLPLGDEAVLKLCGFGIANAAVAASSDPNRVVLYADDEIGMDKFLVYEIPIPVEFSETRGDRHIKVSLAFDPPTRHTRSAYLGVEMSFRLVRGKTLQEVSEHYRRRNVANEGRPPDLESRYNVSFDSGPNFRERGTLQSAVFRIKRNPSLDYGDTYYLVVRCERQWFPDELAMQRFAVAVELSHSEDVELYERVRERVEAPRIRIRPRVV